jgi:hypothetical protein
MAEASDMHDTDKECIKIVVEISEMKRPIGRLQNR